MRAAGGALQRQRAQAVGDVLDLHVEAVAVHVDPAQVGLGRRPAVDVLVEPRDRAVVDDLALRRRTSGCRRPGPTFIFGTSRVTMRSTRRVASLPLTRYLNSGETSMSAAALRIALYSRSWWTS